MQGTEIQKEGLSDLPGGTGKPPSRPAWKVWLPIGIAVVLLCICLPLCIGVAGVATNGFEPLRRLVYTPTPSRTPTPLASPTPKITPFSNRGGYIVTVRTLSDVDSDKVNAFINRLKSMGYQVNPQFETDMGGWSWPQNAILYGNPSCLTALEDIRSQTKDLVTLSNLPVFRLNSGDTQYNAPSIVIQLIDNTNFP